jgi:tetratricopeptide (TPR) repeat protein
LTFVREGDEWKLLREGQPADDLAAEMMEAPTEADRDALLASEPDLAGPPLLTALARLGGAASAAQDYPAALKRYELLRLTARRAGFAKEEGEALQNIANALYFQRRFPEALDAYEQRLALERARGDDAGVAASLAGIATIRYSYAEYSEALARYREALAIQERLDDIAGVAFTAVSIGNIAYLQGDFHGAIAAYRRSLDLNRTMSHADGESRALEGLGRVYLAQGDYAGALDAFTSVISDKRMQYARGRLGSVAQNLGDVYFRLGNLDESKASYERSRQHFEAVKDLPNVGRVLQGVALTELVAARFKSAEDLYQQSGAICSAAGDSVCAAAATTGLAYAQAAQEKYWDAVASYRRAIAEFMSLGRREEAARCEVGLSQALVGVEDFAGAIEAATRARHTALALDSDDVIWRALTAEARAIRKNGDGTRALAVAHAAVGVLDRMEKAARGKPAGSVTPDSAAALTTLAVLQAEQGDTPGAFATSERLRAGHVRAGLATNERDIARGLTQAEREQEGVLSAQLLTRLAQLTREKGLPKPDATRIASLERAVADAGAARGAFIERLFAAHPLLRVWRGLGPQAELLDAAPLVLDRGDVILAFVLDEDDLLAFAIARDEVADAILPGLVVESHVVPVKRRQLAATIQALQHAAVLADNLAWRNAASELMASFPVVIKRRLEDAARVMVLPHDVFWRVPFEALPSRDGVVGDHATVAVSGSLDALARSRRAPEERAQSILGVAAPQVMPERSTRVKQLSAGWSLRTAEGAVEEVDAVSAAVPPGLLTALSGPAATEPAVRDALRTASIAHVAAPFRINAASPLFSPLLLSVPMTPAAATDSQSPDARRDSADDGALELREVMNLEASARIVVFSDGAATSMRDGAAAADVVQWAWLAADVPSLLVARWTAPAAASGRLLAEFHRQVQAGADAAVALRAAQRLVRSGPETAAPVHWAGWLNLGSR